MKKVILIVFMLIVAGGIIWGLSFKNESGEIKNTQLANEDNSEENNTNQSTTEKDNNTENKDNTENIQKTSIENGEIPNDSKTNSSTQEIVISEFSTQIHNKSKERQNNISITCKRISGKEIKPGEIFSFCNTVGEATTEKGYQASEIYVDGEKKQGLGGGNCQVSTTIYNAVLQIPELEVIERHEHSNKVTYIEQGKDAAVAYGSYDFKFKNNTQNTLKLVMENTEDEVKAKIIKLI